MVQKADRLVYNQTTNQAERCVDIKIIIRYQAGIWEHGKKWQGAWSWQAKLFLGGHTLLLDRKISCDRSIWKNVRAGLDEHYGPNTEEPEMETELYNNLSSQLLQKFHSPALERSRKKQRGQHENSVWHEMRKDRLTASNFGSICSLRDSTLSANTVKNIIYPADLSRNADIVYGRLNESKAIQIYEERSGHKVQKYGLFIDDFSGNRYSFTIIYTYIQQQTIIRNNNYLGNFQIINVYKYLAI